MCFFVGAGLRGSEGRTTQAAEPGHAAHPADQKATGAIEPTCCHPPHHTCICLIVNECIILFYCLIVCLLVYVLLSDLPAKLIFNLFMSSAGKSASRTSRTPIAQYLYNGLVSCCVMIYGEYRNLCFCPCKSDASKLFSSSQ